MKLLLDSRGRELKDEYGLPLYEESDLTIPDGIAPNCGNDNAGLKRREDRPGEYSTFWRDEFRRQIIQPEDWAALIREGAGDHVPFVNWIYDQNGVGSCAAEGLCSCADSDRERSGFPKVKFNPWCLYYFSGGGRDQGSTLTENLRIARSRGLVPDDLWPRSQHRWHDVPPDSSDIWRTAQKYRVQEFYEISSSIELVSALFSGHAVYAAYPGHAWQAIQALNTRQIKWRNSWGTQWGENGYGVIDLSRITYQYGLFAIRTTTAA